MAISISLEGIDKAIENLPYRNKRVLKHRLVAAVRAHYQSKDDIDDLNAIATDDLVCALWNTHGDTAAIKNRRKNFNSIKSALNADLKKLHGQGKNEEGIIIGPLNTFEMSDEAKEAYLNAFIDNPVLDSEVDLANIKNVLQVVKEMLDAPHPQSQDQDQNILQHQEGLKSLLQDIAAKVGLSLRAADEPAQQTSTEEKPNFVANAPLVPGGVKPADVNGEPEDIDPGGSDTGKDVEVVLAEDEDLEEVTEVLNDDEIEEIVDPIDDDDIEEIDEDDLDDEEILDDDDEIEVIDADEVFEEVTAFGDGLDQKDSPKGENSEGSEGTPGSGPNGGQGTDVVAGDLGSAGDMAGQGGQAGPGSGGDQKGAGGQADSGGQGERRLKTRHKVQHRSIPASQPPQTEDVSFAPQDEASGPETAPPGLPADIADPNVETEMIDVKLDIIEDDNPLDVTIVDDDDELEEIVVDDEDFEEADDVPDNDELAEITDLVADEAIEDVIDDELEEIDADELDVEEIDENDDLEEIDEDDLNDEEILDEDDLIEEVAEDEELEEVDALIDEDPAQGALEAGLGPFDASGADAEATGGDFGAGSGESGRTAEGQTGQAGLDPGDGGEPKGAGFRIGDGGLPKGFKEAEGGLPVRKKQTQKVPDPDRLGETTAETVGDPDPDQIPMPADQIEAATEAAKDAESIEVELVENEDVEEIDELIDDDIDVEEESDDDELEEAEIDDEELEEVDTELAEVAPFPETADPKGGANDEMAGSSGSSAKDGPHPSVTPIQDPQDPFDEDVPKNNKRMLAEVFNRSLAARDKFYNQHLLIPGGDYILGRSKSKADERPRQTVTLNPFYIGKFPVTNALFEVFVEKTGYRTTAEKNGYSTVYEARSRKEIDPASGNMRLILNSALTKKEVPGACWYQPLGPGSTLHNRRQHPVVQVSFEDAVAFAAWTGKRLPTENEWEAAARTSEGNLYPWGEHFEAAALNFEEAHHGGTTEVERYESFANQLDIADTLGNVWEWTLDIFEPTVSNGNGSTWYVAKGGSFLSTTGINAACRKAIIGDDPSNIVGFRCVAY